MNIPLVRGLLRNTTVIITAPVSKPMPKDSHGGLCAAKAEPQEKAKDVTPEKESENKSFAHSLRRCALTKSPMSCRGFSAASNGSPTYLLCGEGRKCATMA